jgi:hypothetical protein
MEVDFPSDEKYQDFQNLVDVITEEFDNMDWVKSYDRKVVSGGIPCYSMAFGLVIQPSQGVKISRFNDQYPELYALLMELCECLNFQCTTFTINKNLLCKPHRDKNNQGDSIIFSLGDFDGGLFLVEDTKGNGMNEYDIYRRPLLFNGAKCLHETAPFVGTRYSIVLYKLPMEGKWKSPEEKNVMKY